MEMSTQLKPLKTFSSDKHEQQAKPWAEASKADASEPEDPEVETTDKEEQKASEMPVFRPPAIVTESRCPNVLSYAAEIDNPDGCTMIVVQGDDPDTVANQIAVLKKRLFQEEQDGEK